MNPVAWLIARARLSFKQYLCSHLWSPRPATGDPRTCMRCGVAEFVFGGLWVWLVGPWLDKQMNRR